MIPVNVITGFLGSGKTTLLREVLSHPAFKDAVVIVNEFGEVGLDHVLLEEVEEGILLLENGCVCCTIRSDLQDTLHNLQKKSADATIPKFNRVFVETTGLADPSPILSTVLAEPMIRNHFRTGNVVCTVDGVAGLTTIKNHPEATKQIAVADRILLTKSDLGNPSQLAQIEHTLSGINPFAEIKRTEGHDFNASALFANDLANEQSRPGEVQLWLDRASKHIGSSSHGGHIDGLHSFVLELEPSINWSLFTIWLTALLHKHGDKILRIKGILRVKESKTPVVMQCVQHIVHPPMHLSAWPDAMHKSRLVFITRGIEEANIRQSLEVFLSLDETASYTATTPTTHLEDSIYD